MATKTRTRKPTAAKRQAWIEQRVADWKEEVEHIMGEDDEETNSSLEESEILFREQLESDLDEDPTLPERDDDADIPLETTVEDFIANPELLELVDLESGEPVLNQDDTGRILEPESGDFKPGYDGNGTKRSRKAKGKAEVGKAREPKPCRCGCGALSQTGDYAPGHDSRFKSQLLTAARAGDESAAETLVRTFPTLYPTVATITAKGSSGRLSAEERDTRARERVAAKLAKARYQVATLEQELANLA